MKRLFFLLLFLIGSLPTHAADPVRRALIVGVSNYPEAAVGDLQLAGPKNDVALLIDTLPILGIKPDQAIILADGLEEAGASRKSDGMPTRKAILDALATLARDSNPGDFALIYLSGHGSRQPDLNPTKRAVPKPEGLDQTFLPIDIGQWDDGIASVENALLDFELGQAVNRIRDKKAHVWVIIDACHSGTMTRSVGDSVAKQVPMDRLKIPAEAVAKARAGAQAREGQRPARTRSLAGDAPAASFLSDSAPQQPSQAASYVAFFAAYPDQPALQEGLPRGIGAEGKKPRSVMTWYLVQALRSGQAQSYRDLAAQIMAGYEGFGKSPVPMFEGDLGAALPGASIGERRYLARRMGEELTVDAGAMDGFGRGTIVALAAADAPEVILGHAEAQAVALAKTSLAPVERDGKTTAIADYPRDATLLARVIDKGIALAFTVGLPQNPGTTPGEQAVAAALSRFAQETNPAFTFVAGPNPADVYLVLEDDRLWFLHPDASLTKEGREKTPSVSLAGLTDDSAAQRLVGRQLARLAKTRNLIRLAGIMGPAPLREKLEIEGFVLPDDRSSPATARAPDDRPCRRLSPQVPGDAMALPKTGLSLPEIRHCDQVYFRLSNKGDKPIDITPLYIDGEGNTSYHGPHTGIRLEPGATPTVVALNLRSFDPVKGLPEAIGAERLMFIAVEVPERQAIAADFKYLADAQPTRNLVGGPRALRDVLDAAAFSGPRTRSIVSAPQIGGAAGIFEYRWRVVAPPGVR